ncbi:hypothetical protein, partial [Bacillus altitudinis]|uniref:hypothetical protein n=1 Tax=Bacillus altitudinis TaxID=293387 RepID=UPI001F181290
MLVCVRVVGCWIFWWGIGRDWGVNDCRRDWDWFVMAGERECRSGEKRGGERIVWIVLIVVGGGCVIKD